MSLKHPHWPQGRTVLLEHDSKVLRGNPLADWGRAYMDSDQPSGTSVELQLRTGSTETPDSTWSPWTPPLRSGVIRS